LVFLKDITSFEVTGVIKGGRWAYRDGEYILPFPGVSPPRESPFTVPPAGDLKRKLSVKAQGKRLRIIGLRQGQIVTEERVLELPSGGEVLEPHLIGFPKVAVVERHRGTGRVGVGFLDGLGLEEGALGSTIAHDAHNLVLVGMSDEEMLLAVETLRRSGGGLVVVKGAKVLAHLPLPVAGLMSDRSWEEVAKGLEEVEGAASVLGRRVLQHPFMYLSFVALSVIPSLRLTDRGLLDVPSQRFVPLTF